MNKLFNNRWWLLIVLVLLITINWAASVMHSRVDLTNEKRFTLSAPTKKILRSLNSPVMVDVFLKGNYPSGFKKLSSSTEEILQEFREVAGQNFQYNFISPEDPVDGTEVKYSDTLSTLGLYPINLTSQLKEGQQQQFVYPVALVHYNYKTIPVRLYQGKTPLISFQELNSAEAMLEYNLANAISKAGQVEKHSLAYAIGNGQPMDFSVYDLVENTLKADYNLSIFNLNTQPIIPDLFKVLLIVKPKTGFSDEAKFRLDQFVMNGGKLLVFMDRLDAEMDSLQVNNRVIAYDRDLRISDLLFRYGVRVNPDLLMDLQCDFLPFDLSGDGQFTLLPWNYFPVLSSPSNHPVNKNIGFVAGRFVNTIDTVEAEGIRKTILLHSSANARTIGSPAVISGTENVNAPEDAKYKSANLPVAVLLEGKFRSFFANRISQSMNDTLRKYNVGFLRESANDNKMIIVSDGDIVLNSLVKSEPIPMGMNPYTYGTQREFPFANRDFLVNCLDYLINENDLSEAKGKDYTVKLLDPKKVNNEKSFWQLLNIGAPVVLIILFALIFQWRRKRKYSFKNKQ